VVGHPNKGKSSIFAATLANWQILLSGARS
ncbi:MAG: ribosome-binding ATPase YchF (GTP1/OBG family), partial [Pseudohongiellaceae bacterium]